MNQRKNSTLEILGMLAALFLVLSALSFFVQGAESTLLILRFVSIFGLLFSVVGLVLIARIPKQPVITNAPPQIKPEKKSIFVEIHDQSIMHTTPVIDLENLNDLIRIAEWHNTAVFHLTLNFIHLYYVRGVDNVTYRYVLSVGTAGIPEHLLPNETLEKTLPNQIQDQNPYSANKPVTADLQPNTDKSQSVFVKESDVHPASVNHEKDGVFISDNGSSMEYVISATKIEFTESTY